MSRDDPQMKIRLTAVLKTRIEEASSANQRTMNAEIVHRLNTTFETEGAQMARGDPVIYMRLNEQIKAQLLDAAAANRRSLTSEVMYRLQKTFATAAAPGGSDLTGIPTADLLAELGRRCK